MSEDSGPKPQLPDYVVNYLASLGTTPDHLWHHYPHTYAAFATLSVGEINALDTVGAALALDDPKGDNHKDADAMEDADAAQVPRRKVDEVLMRRPLEFEQGSDQTRAFFKESVRNSGAESAATRFRGIAAPHALVSNARLAPLRAVPRSASHSEAPLAGRQAQTQLARRGAGSRCSARAFGSPPGPSNSRIRSDARPGPRG